MEARNKQTSNTGVIHTEVVACSVLDMILPVHDSVRAHVARVLTMLYALDEATLPTVALEYPPNRDLGDLGTPVAFELARRLRKAPRAIAQEIAGAFGALEGIRAVSAAPNGYLNLFLERRTFLLERLRDTGARRASGRRQSHRRTHGNQSEQGRAHRPPAELRARRHAGAGAPLPRYSGRGAELHRRYRRPGGRRGRRLPRHRGQVARRDSRDRRLDALRLLLLGSVRPGHRLVRRRQGAPRRPRADAARHRARRQRQRGRRRIHRRPHRSMPPADDGADERRLRPADVGGRHPAAEILGAGVRRAEGEARRLSADGRTAQGLLGDADPGGREGNSQGPTPNSQGGHGGGQGFRGRGRPEVGPDDEEREKVIVRSNGVVTYVGKDIAYQFWKLGLLGRDFQYRVFVDRRTKEPRQAVPADRVLCGRRHVGRPRATTRCSAAPPTSTTSSTCGSPTCRSC